MFLDADTFRTVVASTPLVSIDLVVRNHAGHILLGQRLNRPAKGFWFVPGGRIFKNESLDEAFRRTTQTELGREFPRSQARLLDIYEHFYTDSVFGDETTSPDTHYVVIGYQLDIGSGMVLSPPEGQHDAYRWWDPQDMASSDEVHSNTRAYLDLVK